MKSDIDVLAEFAPGAVNGVGFRFIRYGDELASILGHKVDFCIRLNRHLVERVRRGVLPVYEHA